MRLAIPLLPRSLELEFRRRVDLRHHGNQRTKQMAELERELTGTEFNSHHEASLVF
jgi:hypothetical protein